MRKGSKFLLVRHTNDISLLPNAHCALNNRHSYDSKNHDQDLYFCSHAHTRSHRRHARTRINARTCTRSHEQTRSYAHTHSQGHTRAHSRINQSINQSINLSIYPSITGNQKVAASDDEYISTITEIDVTFDVAHFQKVYQQQIVKKSS